MVGIVPPAAPGDDTPGSDRGRHSRPRSRRQQHRAPAPAPSRTATHGSPAPSGGGGGYTAESWARALLERLGMPVTSANVLAIVSWEAAEGGHWNNSARFNPLNTTEPEPGSGTMNSVGVRVYDSWEQGLEATVATLRNGHYGAILSALSKGGSAQAVAQAVVDSPWGTQHIGILGSASQYGTGHGGGGNGGAGFNSDGATSTQSIQDYIESNYGYMSAFLNDPTIGPILREAAAQGWDQARMFAALQPTKWWKEHSQSWRQWTSEQKLDPGQYKQDMASAAAKITALSSSLGIHLSGQDVQHLAYAANAFNWSDLQLQQAIGAQYKYNPGKPEPGQAGLDVQKFKQMASDYLVPLSNATIQKWVQQALSGDINVDDYQGYLAQQAKNLYPQLAKAIDSGQTVQQFLDPYRQLAAQTLEVNPDSIDFMQPKWMKAINEWNADKKERQPMSLSDWATLLRTDPAYGWDHTQNAQAEAAQQALAFQQAFGFVGAGAP